MRTLPNAHTLVIPHGAGANATAQRRNLLFPSTVEFAPLMWRQPTAHMGTNHSSWKDGRIREPALSEAEGCKRPRRIGPQRSAQRPTYTALPRTLNSDPASVRRTHLSDAFDLAFDLRL
jgi:hypothetical protein